MRRKTRPELAALLLGLVFAGVLALTGLGDSLELKLLDLRFRLRPPPTTASPVTIVVLRGSRLQDGDVELRDELAAMMATLAGLAPDSRPLAVVVDVFLRGPPKAGGDSQPPIDIIVRASQELGNVVHAFRLALSTDRIRDRDPDIEPLHPHRLPNVARTPLQVFYGIQLPNQAFAERLLSSGAAAGFTNIAGAEAPAGRVQRRLPPAARSGLGDGGTYAALSLAGAAIALSESQPLSSVLSSADGRLRPNAQRLPIPTDDDGMYWINFRNRFSAAVPAKTGNNGVAGPGPGHPPEMVHFTSFSDDRTAPSFWRKEGAPVPPDRLAGQVLLVVDGHEVDSVRTPLGDRYRQSTLHAQAIANFLEEDYLKQPPPGSAWIGVLVLLVLAQLLDRNTWAPSLVTRATLLFPVTWRPTAVEILTLLARPENPLAWTWVAIAAIVFMTSSLWLPISLPVAAMAGSLAGWRLTVVRELKREAERVDILRSEQARLLGLLEQRAGELGELRGRLDDLSRTTEDRDRGGPVHSELPDAEAVENLDQELCAAESLLEKCQRVPTTDILAATSPPDGELVDRIDVARTEIRDLREKLRNIRDRLGAMGASSSTAQAWYQIRVTAYSNTLQHIREALHLNLRRLSAAAPLLNNPQSQSEDDDIAIPAADPHILERTGCLTADPEMKRLLDDIVERIAPSSLPIIVQGETGTGKELVARAVHNASPRTKARFVALNCAVPNPNTLESELFGHVKGAFTGAARARPGLFREADGGTLFLDELGEMSMEMQPKLLRVLEAGEVIPLGGDQQDALRVDVRLVAATNANLDDAIRRGTFRQDLYYRLNALIVRLPPLRARGRDLELLAFHFLEKASVDLDGAPRLTNQAMKELRAHAWPGNIRELKGIIEGLVTLARGDLISGDDVRRRLGFRGLQGGDSEIHFGPKEAALLEKHRRLGFNADACGKDPDYPGNRQTAYRHLRVLMSKALWLSGWDPECACRLMAGDTDSAPLPVVRSLLRRFLENLDNRLKTENESLDGEAPPGHDTSPLRASLARQFRSDKEHLFRVLDAIDAGRLAVPSK